MVPDKAVSASSLSVFLKLILSNKGTGSASFDNIPIEVEVIWDLDLR